MFHDQPNLAAQHIPLEVTHARQVEFVDQLVMDAALEVLIFLNLGLFRAACYWCGSLGDHVMGRGEFLLGPQRMENMSGPSRRLFTGRMALLCRPVRTGVLTH